MTLGPDDDAVVSYTVKELLRDIKGSVDQLNGKMDAKADKSDVVQLTKVVDNHDERIGGVETRVTVLETQRDVTEKTDTQHGGWLKWAVTTLIALAVLVVSILGYLATTHK